MGEKKEKESGGATVVLKTDFHCDGCASKVMKFIRSFDGVEKVKIGGQKITVVGEVDPAELRAKVEEKMHKKVELVSAQPKKDGDNKENSGGGGGGGGGGGDKGKQEKKKESEDKKSNDKSDQKSSKEKEPPVTTAVLKLNLHCDGCIHKIYKTITKTKGLVTGCQELNIDKQKDLVTVTGAMDMKALAEQLQKQLKRDVTIVPPKKEGEKKEKGGGGGGGGKEKSGGDEKMEWNRMQTPFVYPYPYMYGPPPGIVGDQFQYNPYTAQYHPPQMFSDENPNACSVM